MTKEVAVGTVIQSPPRSHDDRHPHWHRPERAERFDQYLERHAQGVSQRQAAQTLEVPRSTLQAWQAYHESLDEHPAVVAFVHSAPGLAFLPRLVLGIHLVGTEVGACGMRLVCLLLPRTGLDRFVGASYGPQQQVNRQVEEAIGAYRREESARVARDMPTKNITLAKDETFTGGRGLVAMDPESNDLLWEQAAQGRAQDTWQALMEQALSGLNCRVIPSTSDEAPGLLAYVEHSLGAHHSPDWVHVPHALVKAVSGPMATKQRAAGKAATEAPETLEQVQRQRQGAGGAPENRGPGRPPKAPASLEPAAQTAQTARLEPQRMRAQREPVAQSLRALGQAYHFGDVERGVRRNGTRIAADIQAQSDRVRTVAPHEGLRQTCLERIAKAARVVPKMPAPIECVSGDVRQQVRQLDLTPPVSYALHAPLMPSCSLERVAQTRTVSAGEPLRALAERLRTPLFGPGGV